MTRSERTTRIVTAALGLVLLSAGLERLFHASGPHWDSGLSLTVAALVAFHSALLGRTFLDRLDGRTRDYS
jgi:membrane protein implicated in regulation of membrane protease activity